MSSFLHFILLFFSGWFATIDRKGRWEVWRTTLPWKCYHGRIYGGIQWCKYSNRSCTHLMSKKFRCILVLILSIYNPYKLDPLHYAIYIVIYNGHIQKLKKHLLFRHCPVLSFLFVMTSVGNVICEENNSLLRSPELMYYDHQKKIIMVCKDTNAIIFLNCIVSVTTKTVCDETLQWSKDVWNTKKLFLQKEGHIWKFGVHVN